MTARREEGVEQRGGHRTTSGSGGAGQVVVDTLTTGQRLRPAVSLTSPAAGGWRASVRRYAWMLTVALATFLEAVSAGGGPRSPPGRTDQPTRDQLEESYSGTAAVPDWRPAIEVAIPAGRIGNASPCGRKGDPAAVPAGDLYLVISSFASAICETAMIWLRG